MGLASYKEKGIEAHGYVCDVTDEEQVKAMVAKIKEEVGVIGHKKDRTPKKAGHPAFRMPRL